MKIWEFPIPATGCRRRRKSNETGGETMKKLAILGAAVMVIVCFGSCATESEFRQADIPAIRAESFEVYDRNWELQGHVVRGSFADWYRVYDENWRLKGYIKWNEFSGRCELFDEGWNKEGSISAVTP